jgi:hypothetical protein
MGGRVMGRMESFAERGASVVLGGAVAYAAVRLLSGAIPELQLALTATAVGAISCLLSLRALNAAARRAPQFAVPVFDVRDLEELESDELLLTERVNDELVLTDADRLDSPAPLELDDILAQIGPDSRVVRLFDRKAMPTPGQLKTQIDSHLEQAAAPHAQPDASQALSDALAELRRSLR